MIMHRTTRVALLTKSESKIRITSAVSKIQKILKEFCDDSTVGGLKYISGSKKSSLKSRIYFGLSFAVCSILTVYNCYASVQDYLKYNLKTELKYDTVSKLDFPAITICNANRARKSIIGQDDFILNSIAWLFSWRNDTTTIPTTRRTCKLIRPEDNGRALWQMSQIMTHFSITELNRLIGFDSAINVQKCWWNNAKINCNEVFVNHYFEEYFCFTFNQDPSYVNMGGEKTYYGMDEGYNKNRTTISGGETGFQVLLNTRQDEYCITIPFRSGAGFFVLIHDPKTLSSFQTQPSFDISPGFEHTISFSPILFDLRGFSKSRGRCNNYFKNILKQHDTEYTQESCLAQCLFDTIWSRCGCVFAATDSPVYSELTAQYLQVSKANLFRSSCGFAQQYCIKDVMHDIIVSGEFYCPNCKRSCLETKYEFQISSKKISPSTTKLLSNNGTFNNNYIRKNFVLAKFSFKNMEMLTINELQMVTPIDLFMSIANIMILFLGMSMISHYELVHLVLIICHFAISNHIKKKLDIQRRRQFFMRRLSGVEYNIPLQQRPARSNSKVAWIHRPSQTTFVGTVVDVMSEQRRSTKEAVPSQRRQTQGDAVQPVRRRRSQRIYSITPLQCPSRTNIYGLGNRSDVPKEKH